MTSQNQVPRWAAEAIHLEPYDTEWPKRAIRFASEVEHVLGTLLLQPIEHVGSTSIPGLVAKPIIDLMVQVADIEKVAANYQNPLLKHGWHFVPPELDGRPWRRFFVKASSDGEHRLAHLHMMQPGEKRWGEQLRFRDALRSDAELRDQYGELKQDLATTYANDREAYTNSKSDFVLKVLSNH